MAPSSSGARPKPRKRVLHQVATRAHGATAEGLRAIIQPELAITSDADGLSCALWIRFKGKAGSTVVDVTPFVASALRNVLCEPNAPALKVVEPEIDATALLRLPLNQLTLDLGKPRSPSSPPKLTLYRGGSKPGVSETVSGAPSTRSRKDD